MDTMCRCGAAGLFRVEVGIDCEEVSFSWFCPKCINSGPIMKALKLLGLWDQIIEDALEAVDGGEA